MNDRGGPTCERHESLYSLDGNLVLRATRPDKLDVLFRVHKSVLSSHSPVFADMFDVCTIPPHSPNVAPDHIYDGVPLVRIPDDARHLESVLKVLYYQIDLPWTPRSPGCPALIAPILELSRKYGIDRLRDQIRGHPESDWPQTLQDWDRLGSEAEYMVKDSNVGWLDDHLPEPASVIQLARQYEIASVLPAAFYHLSRLSILDDRDRTRADPGSFMDTTKRTARWGLLTTADFRRLLFGKAEVATFVGKCINTEELCRHGRSKSHFGTGLATSGHCQAGAQLLKDVWNRCSQSKDPLALLKSLDFGSQRIWEELGDLFHLNDGFECVQSKGAPRASVN